MNTRVKYAAEFTQKLSFVLPHSQVKNTVLEACGSKLFKFANKYKHM